MTWPCAPEAPICPRANINGTSTGSRTSMIRSSTGSADGTGKEAQGTPPASRRPPTHAHLGFRAEQLGTVEWRIVNSPQVNAPIHADDRTGVVEEGDRVCRVSAGRRVRIK